MCMCICMLMCISISKCMCICFFFFRSNISKKLIFGQNIYWLANETYLLLFSSWLKKRKNSKKKTSTKEKLNTFLNFP